MRLALFLAILALPLLEIAVLIKMGGLTGFGGILLLILATAGLGVVVLRRNGLKLASHVRQAAETGRIPTQSVLEGALVALAGMLLIAPGVITDAIGLLLLIPPLRSAAAAWGGRMASTDIPGTSFPGHRAPGGDIIEGEFERLDERDTDPR